MEIRSLWITCLSLLAATGALAQVTITGTSTQVTDHPSRQLDPNISGDIVVYTDDRNGNDDVYYTDLGTGAEVQVTAGPFDERLHDVSLGRIVYTDLTGFVPSAWVYEVATGTATQLEDGGFPQQDPTVDGDLVVYEWFRGPGTADVALVDLAAGTTVALTDTDDHEAHPVVGGGHVVFERSSSHADTDRIVYLYDLATGAEQALGPGYRPHTDGRTVIYLTLTTPTDPDVVLYDIATGATTTLQLPGAQQRPRVQGDLIAFDDVAGGESDVVLRHLPSGATERISLGPLNHLNDLDGNRVAYTSNAAGNLDIWVFEFELQGLEPPSVDACHDTSGLVPLFEERYERDTGAPLTVGAAFAAPGFDQGVVVVENDSCAAAEVELNGELIVAPDDVNPGVTCGSGVVPLAPANKLSAEVRSRPGCAVTVAVYGIPPAGWPAPAAEQDSEQGLDDEAGCASVRAAGHLPFAAFAVLLCLAARRRRQR